MTDIELLTIKIHHFIEVNTHPGAGVTAIGVEKISGAVFDFSGVFGSGDFLVFDISSILSLNLVRIEKPSCQIASQIFGLPPGI